jgi:hypothetical protein
MGRSWSRWASRDEVPVAQTAQRAPVFVVAAATASAAVLWHNLPEPTDIYKPFDVSAAIGQQATGRGITATVTGVRIGPKVHKVSPPSRTEQSVGAWVVVDAVVAATRDFELPHTELIVGPNTYIPSDRLWPDPLGAELEPGIAQRGSWVFEVPTALIAIDATHPISLQIWLGDERLDSRLVIRIPLDDVRVRREDVVALEPVTKAAI